MPRRQRDGQVGAFALVAQGAEALLVQAGAFPLQQAQVELPSRDRGRLVDPGGGEHVLPERGETLVRGQIGIGGVGPGGTRGRRDGPVGGALHELLRHRAEILPADAAQRGDAFRRHTVKEPRLAALEEDQGVAAADAVGEPLRIAGGELVEAAPVGLLGELPEPRPVAPDDLGVGGGRLDNGFDDHLGAARHALQFVGLGDDEALPRLQVQSDPHNDLGEGAEAGLKVSYHNCFVSF
jgi:hypothetical protein